MRKGRSSFLRRHKKALALGLTGAAATYGLYKTGEILYHDKLGTIPKKFFSTIYGPRTGPGIGYVLDPEYVKSTKAVSSFGRRKRKSRRSRRSRRSKRRSKRRSQR